MNSVGTKLERKDSFSKDVTISFEKKPFVYDYRLLATKLFVLFYIHRLIKNYLRHFLETSNVSATISFRC